MLDADAAFRPVMRRAGGRGRLAARTAAGVTGLAMVLAVCVLAPQDRCRLVILVTARCLSCGLASTDTAARCGEEQRLALPGRD